MVAIIEILLTALLLVARRGEPATLKIHAAMPGLEPLHQSVTDRFGSQPNRLFKS